MKDAGILSKELMQNILMNLGFTETEAHIYLYLMKEGGQKARDIGQALNLYKQQLYRSLRKMQSKGIIKASGYPAHFSAVPFEKVVDLSIRANIEKAEYVIQKREELLSGWRSIIRKEFSDS
jgi:sugar-specific transcriptional regulator TrmB